ncbi:hypothetical protein MCOR31_002066 [Pyricularia oryzae]|nr:hypothetical protein MCOR32_005251 [Pyricularia oryzae]KAI6375708.1 hypothetical protein MCOR31_002066 [Pyricularia oryzae]
MSSRLVTFCVALMPYQAPKELRRGSSAIAAGLFVKYRAGGSIANNVHSIDLELHIQVPKPPIRATREGEAATRPFSPGKIHPCPCPGKTDTFNSESDSSSWTLRSQVADNPQRRLEPEDQTPVILIYRACIALLLLLLRML